MKVHLHNVEDLWEENADSEWASSLSPRDLVEDPDYCDEAAMHCSEAEYDVSSMDHWVGVFSEFEKGSDIPPKYAIRLEPDTDVIEDGYHRLSAARWLGFDVIPATYDL